MIKRMVILTLMVFTSLMVKSQDKQNIIPGYYAGLVEENGSQNTYILKFGYDGYITQIYIDEKEESTTVRKYNFKFKQTSSHNQITTLEWINSGGKWTETQLFICTKISDDELEVLHIRYVVNRGSEGESWYYGGKSVFIRDSDGFIDSL